MPLGAWARPPQPYPAASCRHLQAELHSGEDETDPPLALQPRDEAVPSVDGLEQVPSPGVHQQPRAAVVAEEAAPAREGGKGRGVELTGERYRTSAPRVGEEVSQDRVDGRSRSAHLHDLARPGRVEVVEVPAGDLPGRLAHNDLLEGSGSRLAGHQLEQPLRRVAIVARSQGPVARHVVEALDERVDVELIPGKVRRQDAEL